MPPGGGGEAAVCVQCLREGPYLSHSLQGNTLGPSALPGRSGVRLGPVLGLELRMDSLL